MSYKKKCIPDRTRNNLSHQFDIVATSASTAFTIVGDGVNLGTVYFDNVSIHEVL